MNTIVYFIELANYLAYMICFHNIIYNNYPFNHTVEIKHYNILESFNVITNIIVCYNLLVNIYKVNMYDVDEFTYVSDNSIISMQILGAQLIYETIYYFIVIGRKDNFVLIHHVYSIITLFSNLYYNVFHYQYSLIALTEFTNPFLSIVLICKRNDINTKFLIVNDTLLMIFYFILRIMLMPYAIYKGIYNYEIMYSIHPYIYINGLFTSSLLYCMSVHWFKILCIKYSKKYILPKKED